MPPFHTKARLRFHHMDRAGMVFNGAYVELLQDAFEDLMEHVGLLETELEPRLGVRLPVVRIEVEFPKAAQGNRIAFAVTLARIGNTSANFRIVGRDATDAECVRATIVRVCIDKDGRSTPLPAQIRKAWEPYVETSK